jgi:hypothetical protein
VQVNLRSLGKFEGAYRVAAVSGLVTGVAAASPTAGHLFAMRWSPPTSGPRILKVCLIQRIRAKWRTISGFTAAQEVGLDLSVLRGYSANHSGGTAVTLTTQNQQKRGGTTPSTTVSAQGMLPSLMADMRIAAAGALTAGTHTFDAQPIARDGYSENAAAATVPLGRFDMEFLNADAVGDCPIVLGPNEGLCIRNVVAQGAGGTARIIVEVDWLELTSY